MGQLIGGEGTLYIKADGINITASGDVTSGGGWPVRETKIVGYYTEKEGIPYISCTAINSKEISIESLAKLTKATVTAEFKNGKVRILRNAYLVGDIEENHTDGTVPLKFEGEKGGRWD